jgi:hypothetical protein
VHTFEGSVDMTDYHQDLLHQISCLRDMVDKATLGPWRSMEDRDTWSLHGEARQFKGKLKYGAAPSMQIAKAPKRNSPYAEYWPNFEDNRLLIKAVNSFPFWLDWAEDVLTRHFPTSCGCQIDSHMLCAPHRQLTWKECPEVRAVVRALEQLHGGEDVPMD